MTRQMPPVHPAANLFPMLPDDELKALSEDIRANGLQQPIVMYGQYLLDGRNRWKACKLAGVEPKLRDWNGTPEEAIRYVGSMNLKRRDLTATVRAAVSVSLEEMEATAARKRMAQGGGDKKSGVEKVPRPIEDKGKARDKAAAQAGVNAHYVSDAKAIKKIAPDMFEKMRAGEMSITEAKRQIKRAEVTKSVEPMPSGRYRVIYADPPWQYNDSRAGLVGFAATAAEDHYPTMPTTDICALPVRELADDNAVLFCWATFPLLTDAIEVIRAWGFQYKTAFVWAKGRPNFGHYHNANAELLIVATRGSCTPDADKRESQVQAIERTARHSEKPEEFRAMIDRLYPNGRAIELFRRGEKIRTDVREWDIWGNEAKAAS